MLRPGAAADARGRSRPLLLVLAGVGFTATRVDLTRLRPTSCSSAATPTPRSCTCSTTRRSRRRCAAGRSRRPTTSSSPTRAGSSTCRATGCFARADPRRADGAAPQQRRRALRHDAASRSSATRSRTRSTRRRSRSRRRAGAGSPPATTSPRMRAAEPAGGVAARRRRRRARGARAAPVGAPPRACRWSTTPTRTRTSSRGAIGMFGHTYNPNYFINPPAYTYLLHAAFALGFGGRDGVSEALRRRPGRRLRRRARAARRCSARVAVGLLAWAGRGCSTAASASSPRRCSRSPSCPCTTPTSRSTTSRRWRRVCLALVGVAGVYARGRLGDYALAGAGLGLACATKYTGGIVLLPLLAAALVGPRAVGPAPGRAGSRSRACSRSPFFLTANPFALLDFDSFRDGLSEQSAASSDGGGKLGLTGGQRDPLLPRDDHLGARLAAGRWPRSAARVALAVRDWRRALVLVPVDRSSSSPSWARRTASSPAGCCRSTRCCACSPPTARCCSRPG